MEDIFKKKKEWGMKLDIRLSDTVIVLYPSLYLS